MKLDRFLIAGAVVACLGLSSACNSNQNTDSDHLVILHTNDTHSSIDPDLRRSEEHTSELQSQR